MLDAKGPLGIPPDPHIWTNVCSGKSHGSLEFVVAWLARDVVSLLKVSMTSQDLAEALLWTSHIMPDLGNKDKSTLLNRTL